ncbi:hypothetical protein ABT369_39650 [Dactylosporangium sp. NPDC000244]|uniref:hypothetical protein n=1 Tax=Dactylosporangium sp. NPDC000244 TaxID=3154365 RepID=UPI003326607B
MVDTSWAAEGSIAAEFDRRYTDSRVSFTTVERLTATQVICASGNRYYRQDGRIVGGQRIEILPVENQAVRDTIAREQVEQLRFRLYETCKDVRGGEAVMLAVLDQLEQQIAAARAAINNPTSA